MAGYKGAGLALTLGLLAGTLNGALFGRDCVDFNAEPDRVTNTGQFVVALDPSRFQKLEHFKAEVDRHVRSLRDSKALPGQTVRLPGDQRAKRRAERLANGLALPVELVKQLDALAGELGARKLRDRSRGAPRSASCPGSTRASTMNRSKRIRTDVVSTLPHGLPGQARQ